MMIAEDSQGTHWILAELHLLSNTVHLFDWIGNLSPQDYQHISGVVVLPPIKMHAVPALQHCLSCHWFQRLMSARVHARRESSDVLCNVCSTTLWTSHGDA